MAIIPKGKEPANVKKRIDTLFPKLDGAYPDKVIIGLQRDHKKWDETAREISRQLGYENKNDFLIAYGYKIEKAETGRPKGNPLTVIEELKRRYPNGSAFAKYGDLVEANPDLAGQIKTLSNRANELFRMTLGKYLMSIGLLSRVDHKTQDKKQLEELIAELKKRYPEGTELPQSISQLKNDNADLPINRLRYIKEVFEMSEREYLVRSGLVLKKDPEEELLEFINELRTRYANKPTPQLVGDFKRENPDLPFLSFEALLRNKGTTLGKYLEKNGLITYQKENPLPEDGIDFAGRAFASTGLDEWQENKIAKLVRERGGFFRNCVSKNTDYLIKNPDFPQRYRSPKYESAQAWIAKGVDIRIFDYQEFMDLVKQTSFEAVPEFIIKDGVLIRYTGKKQSVIIPEGVVEIGKTAFDGCNHIVSLTIPDTVKNLKSSAFINKTKLENIVLPKGLKEISKFAFSDCVSLSSVRIPTSVTVIEEGAFRGCASLTSITLPDGLNKIGFGAFQWCTSLRVLVIPESVTEIEKEAFYRCSKLFICAPTGSCAEKYAKKHNIPLIAECDIDNLPTEKKLLPLFKEKSYYNCKKDLFGSSSYSYRLRTKSKEALNACLSYIAYGEGGDSFDPEKGIYDAEVEIYEQEDEYIAEIAYKTEIYMDLPNFFDEGAECMYTYCKDMVTETGACPFKFSFSMSERHGNYFHVGDSTFDGKTISYFDNASVNCMEPADSNAMAEYVNGEFVNEEKDFNTEIPD